MSAPLGIILAGGQARRMGGGDKALLPLGHGTLMDEVIARLSPQVSALALNANGDPARLVGFRLPVIADSIDGFVGPLGGVLAGLDYAAANGASQIVTVAADTPFFPCDLVPQLMLAAGNAPIVLAKTDRIHPTFGLWPTALRDDLRTALAGGMRKILAWTDTHGAATATFPVGQLDPFFNVNTPEDLITAQAHYAGKT